MKKRHLDFVLLTDEEHEKLCKLLTPAGAARWIEELNDYLGSIRNKNKYANHYFVIRRWAKRQGAGSGVQGPADNHARSAERFVIDLKEHSSWPDMPTKTRQIVYAVLLKRRQQWTAARKQLIEDPPISEQLKADFLAEARRAQSKA